MSKISNSPATETAISRLTGSTFGTGDVVKDLHDAPIIDISDDYKLTEGMLLQLPATEDEWNSKVFKRDMPLNGRAVKVYGMVLDVVELKEGKYQPTGDCKVVYFSSFRKIGVPCDPETLKIIGKETVRPHGSVYNDLIKCANMGDFVKKMIKERTGNRLKVSALHFVTVARNEYNPETKKYITTGTRKTVVIDWDWA